MGLFDKLRSASPEATITKPVIESKTIWVNALIWAVGMVWPPLGEMIKAYPDIALTIYSCINIILRFITDSKLTLTKKS